ncbi:MULTISPECIES: microcompartment protein PduM [Escherichia]|uniref:microcompartment protein PduM n=1 Tax=Escherichia TaxID=561 RepID=UPI0007E40EBD|nr:MULTISPECIES: microcompartment protein PduM [Escherichia]MEC9496287.1 microcompartment protein PduM [Escherichia whittamii]MEC9562511.1 microcompartment protein PduM [Escherichia whittamii]QLX45120.1 microcompartment protein PduM [Escherichia coli]
MNSVLMQHIVDEVIFRLKQRAGKTLALTVPQLREASVHEIVRQYASLQIRYVDLPLLRQLADNETSDRAALFIHGALAWGVHIQLSLQNHFLNAIKLQALARLPLTWCDEQGQPIYLHHDRLLSYADIAQLCAGILVLQRKCCVTALAREAAITRNIQLIRQE